jgi:hypothetical protein
MKFQSPSRAFRGWEPKESSQNPITNPTEKLRKVCSYQMRSSTPTLGSRQSKPPFQSSESSVQLCFRTLTANIRQRRGSKVSLNMPIFHDTNTPRPFIDPSIPWDRNLFPGDKGQSRVSPISNLADDVSLMIFTSEAKEGAALPDHIYMDSMGFGMGCCCLQITFQTYNVDEARRVYDALIPIGPIMVSSRLDLDDSCTRADDPTLSLARIDSWSPDISWVSGGR